MYLYCAAYYGHEATKSDKNQSVVCINDFELTVTDFEHKGALQLAASKGHTKLVELILSIGVDINYGAGESFIFDLDFRHLPEFADIFDAMSEVTGRTALYLAVRASHLATVENLLAAGAAVDGRARLGEIVLNDAAQAGHAEVASCVSIAGSDADTYESKFGAPLLVAAENGDTAVVERLLTAGANVNLFDENGRIPLHSAASREHDVVVERLLRGGAVLERRFRAHSVTPLHLAAMSGHISVVKRLLVAGARFDAGGPGSQAETLRTVKAAGYSEILKIIESERAGQA